jgi:hypothetical protein
VWKISSVKQTLWRDIDKNCERKVREGGTAIKSFAKKSNNEI